MARRKVMVYEEGSCFVLPLGNGGFARGIVARMNGKGRIFGYFYGPRLASTEDANFDGIIPDYAILLADFGDLGLLNGSWRVYGQLPNWNRALWPMPPLIRVDESENRAWLSWYDDKTFVCTMEAEVEPQLASQYPEDATWGYRAVEIDLSRRIAS